MLFGNIFARYQIHWEGRVGRPSFGVRAMTAAEKQRRYRARKAAATPPVTKAAPPSAEPVDRTAAARELIAAMTPAERFSIALYAVAGLEDWRQPHFANWYNEILMRDRPESGGHSTGKSA
jgi:hypothetical protein